MTLQPQYSLLVREIESEIVPASLDAGIGLLPWSPLGGGWLSGQVQAGRASRRRHPAGREPGARHGGVEGPQRQSAHLGGDRGSRGHCRAHGVSASQVALAWLADQPAVTSVILGARTTDQLADNLAAAELRLTEGRCCG